MTEFRKSLNKLLKEDVFAKIVNDYNSSRMTFKEAIWSIAERMELEDDVFWEVKNDMFVMADMTDEELQKKIKDTKTSELEEYLAWRRGLE